MIIFVILLKLEFHECDFAINMLFGIDFDLFFSDHGCLHIKTMGNRFWRYFAKIMMYVCLLLWKIVISHLELDGSVTENSEFCLLQGGEKVYDSRLIWPYSLLCCDPQAQVKRH